MSDCITAIVFAIIIALFLGDGDGCDSKCKHNHKKDRRDLPCGCDD